LFKNSLKVCQQNYITDNLANKLIIMADIIPGPPTVKHSKASQQHKLCGCKTAAISLQFEPNRLGVEPGKGLHYETQQNIQTS
jgi:hypothetical protein